MPAYNFKARFAESVARGFKQQTIRGSARGAQPGGTAYLYTGQRTRSCRKLGEGIITDVLPIEIFRHGCGEPQAYITDKGKQWHVVHAELDLLAKADGFGSGEEMVSWFEENNGLPFTGFLHKWRLIASP